MNKITPLSIQIHNDGYCSQMRTPFHSPQTIEEGVNIIARILKKDVLCRHDVKDINQVCRAIDLLERKIDRIPKINSQHALEEIIKKVKSIALEFKAESLISLYHLQNLPDKNLPIDENYNALRSKFEDKPEENEAIAIHLPCCYSETQFDEDAKSLVGTNRSEKVTKILQQKKEKLKSYEQTKQVIVNKKSELENYRKEKPNNYPAYFDELLDNGFIHLYNHLIQMKNIESPDKRQNEIKKMTFSQISWIVLEAREAIIQKVESAIPVGHSNVLFLLGSTRVGKSTTLCFLRGDEMVLEGSNYRSRNEKELIGHEEDTSFTFLPNVEIVKDLVIIDFSGFDDTHGSLISMSTEFALKALLDRYNSKILVLEAITSNEHGLKPVAQVGSRLRRLLENKKNCILGITKYSKDSDFKDIRKIEEQQKEKLSAPTPDENKLIGAIEALSDMKDPDLLPTIQKKQHELAKLQQDRQQKLQLPLPETDAKVKYRKEIKEREAKLKKAIGLKRKIRFWNLEDSNYLSSCLSRLAKQKKFIRTNARLILDPDDEDLLNHLFKNDLTKEIENGENEYPEFKDVKAFEQSILESSLLYTVFSQSKPEIGRFLHLPEMDPKIVREFDKKIVHTCVKEYIEYTIATLNISFIEKMIKEMPAKVSKSKLDNFNKKIKLLRKYVMGLLGVTRLEDPEQVTQKWIQIQTEHKTFADDVEKRFELSIGAKIGLLIPLGIPYGIFTLVKWNKLNKASQETIDKCCDELEQMYETLQKLKELETIVEKKDKIDEAFNSVQISEQSASDLLKSIQDRINKVRSIYGRENWDRRVSFLADKFLSTKFKSNEHSHIVIISILAYTIIAPNSSYDFVHDVIFNIIRIKEIQQEIKKHEGKQSFIDIFDKFYLQRVLLNGSSDTVFSLIFTPNEETIKILDKNMKTRELCRILVGLTEFAFDTILNRNLSLMYRVLYAAAILKAHGLLMD